MLLQHLWLLSGSLQEGNADLQHTERGDEESAGPTLPPADTSHLALSRVYAGICRQRADGFKTAGPCLPRRELEPVASPQKAVPELPAPLSS